MANLHLQLNWSFLRLLRNRDRSLLYLLYLIQLLPHQLRQDHPRKGLVELKDRYPYPTVINNTLIPSIQLDQVVHQCQLEQAIPSICCWARLMQNFIWMRVRIREMRAGP